MHIFSINIKGTLKSVLFLITQSTSFTILIKLRVCIKTTKYFLLKEPTIFRFANKQNFEFFCRVYK